MYVPNQHIGKSQGKSSAILCKTLYFLFNSNLWESMGVCDPPGFWSVCTRIFEKVTVEICKQIKRMLLLVF